MKTSTMSSSLLDTKEFKCEDCSSEFRTKSKLWRHMKTMHDSIPTDHFQCDVCFRFTTKQKPNFYAHWKAVHLHNAERYWCDHCHYKPKLKSSLTMHLVAVHMRTSDKFCDSCSYHTGQKYNLYCHIATQHLGLHVTNRVKDRILCDLCSYSTFVRFQMGRHLEFHHSHILPTGKQLPCPFPSCGKTFAIEQRRQVHIRLHTGTKVGTCEFCLATFSDMSNYVRHKKMHSGMKEYKCDQCAYETHYKSGLIYHLKETRVICRYSNCKKAFKTERGLERHFRTHTEDNRKKQECTVCKRRFPNNKLLALHQKKIHSNQHECETGNNEAKSEQLEEKEEYKCDNCVYEAGKKFRIVTHLWSGCYLGNFLF